MRKIYLFYLMSLLVVGACRRDDVYMASQMSLNESEQRGPDAADNVTRSCNARDYSQNNKIITYNL